MKHFVTGGSGFFGLHLLNTLLAKNEEIIVFDQVALDDEYQKRGVKSIVGDIRNLEQLTAAMAGADFVHHNAAVLPISRSGNVFWEVNVEGTRNVLKAALQNKVKKVLNVSTSAVYGIPRQVPITEQTPLTPLGDYGTAKFDAEEVCRAFRKEHDLDISIVRPRTLVGTGRLGIFGILFDWIRRGKHVYVIGDGKNLFQLLSARDMAEACYLMTIKECKNEDFNLGADAYGTVQSDLDELIKHARTNAKVRPVNAFIVRNILSFLDLLRMSPLVDWHYKTPHKPFYFDISKAKTMLGWQPQDSNIQMYRDTYDWFINHREEVEKSVGTTHRKSVKQGMLKVLRIFS